MDWIRLIGGGFARHDANFGQHQTDQGRAERYADEVVRAGLDWEDVEAHVNGYADKRGWSDEMRAMQMDNVRAFMADWL